MGRKKDRGPYVGTNVSAMLCEDNIRDGNIGKIVSQETRQKLAKKSMGNKGRKGQATSDLHRDRLSQSLRGKKKTLQHCKNISLGKKAAARRITFYEPDDRRTEEITGD